MGNSDSKDGSVNSDGRLGPDVLAAQGRFAHPQHPQHTQQQHRSVSSPTAVTGAVSPLGPAAPAPGTRIFWKNSELFIPTPLRVLQLANQGLGSKEIKGMTRALTAHGQMRVVDLSRNHKLGPSSTSLEIIGTWLSQDTTVELLDLSACEMTDRGVQHLARAIQSNPNLALVELRLLNNRLTDNSAHLLFSSLLRNATIATINMVGNKNVSLHALHMMKSIRSRPEMVARGGIDSILGVDTDNLGPPQFVTVGVLDRQPTKQPQPQLQPQPQPQLQPQSLPVQPPTKQPLSQPPSSLSHQPPASFEKPPAAITPPPPSLQQPRSRRAQAQQQAFLAHEQAIDRALGLQLAALSQQSVEDVSSRLLEDVNVALKGDEARMSRFVELSVAFRQGSIPVASFYTYAMESLQFEACRKLVPAMIISLHNKPERQAQLRRAHTEYCSTKTFLAEEPASANNTPSPRQLDVLASIQSPTSPPFSSPSPTPMGLPQQQAPPPLNFAPTVRSFPTPTHSPTVKPLQQAPLPPTVELIPTTTFTATSTAKTATDATPVDDWQTFTPRRKNSRIKAQAPPQPQPQTQTARAPVAPAPAPVVAPAPVPVAITAAQTKQPVITPLARTTSAPSAATVVTSAAKIPSSQPTSPLTPSADTSVEFRAMQAKASAAAAAAAAKDEAERVRMAQESAQREAARIAAIEAEEIAEAERRRKRDQAIEVAAREAEAARRAEAEAHDAERKRLQLEAAEAERVRIAQAEVQAAEDAERKRLRREEKAARKAEQERLAAEQALVDAETERVRLEAERVAAAAAEETPALAHAQRKAEKRARKEAEARAQEEAEAERVRQAELEAERLAQEEKEAKRKRKEEKRARKEEKAAAKEERHREKAAAEEKAPSIPAPPSSLFSSPSSSSPAPSSLTSVIDDASAIAAVSAWSQRHTTQLPQVHVPPVPPPMPPAAPVEGVAPSARAKAFVPYEDAIKAARVEAQARAKLATLHAAYAQAAADSAKRDRDQALLVPDIVALLRHLHTLFPGDAPGPYSWAEPLVSDRSPAAVKKAYLRASLAVHPDKQHGTTASRVLLSKALFPVLQASYQAFQQAK